MNYQIADDGSSVDMGDGRKLYRQRRRYFSRVRLNAARTGSSGSFVYTIPATTVRPFSYRIGDAVPGHSGSVATRADTNIELGRRPNQGDVLFINGIGLEVLPRTNSELLKLAIDRTVVSIEHSAGGNNELLGHMSAFPSGRGIQGVGESATGVRPIAGGPAGNVGFPQIGVPALQNQNLLDVALVWDGLADSFALALEPVEAIALTTEMVNQTAAAGVLGQTMPADGAVFIDVMCHLLAEVFNPQPVQG